MLKIIAAASFVALVVGLPLPAAAETTAAPTAQQAHRPTGPYRRQMRARHNQSRERARASAEHVRKVRQGQ